MDPVLLGSALALLAMGVGVFLVERSRRVASKLPEDRLPLAAEEREQLHREKRRSDEIIERMAEGVLVLDQDLTPVIANGAARTLLGLQEVSLPPRLPSEELLAVATRALEEEQGAEEIVSVWFPVRMSLRVRAARLEDRGGVVVVAEDVTQELQTQRIRREFVTHASHELKSPVASLQALAEALRESLHDDPSATERFAGQLLNETERLGRLIRDLLDLSRLEEAVDSPTEPIDLTDVATRETALVEPTAAQKGIHLDVAIDHGVWVSGDDHQLGLMVRNLLDNALRYTSTRGKVSIEVTRDSTFAIVRVVDDGIGIPLESQSRIFERFYRVDRARSRDRGGTGLGLAIVKHVVELHGGEIDLESELGRGSTFTIRLPYAAPEQPVMRSVAS